MGIEIQKAVNRHKFRSITYLFIAVTNIILSIPLAKKLGPIGSALGTGMATIIGDGLIMNWYYSKYIGIDIRGFWKSIISVLKGMTIPIVLAILINIKGINNIYEFTIFSFVILISYLLSIWSFSFNKFEKNIFYTFINKIRDTK